MEYEVRFYYPSDMYDDLVDKLSNISDLQKGYRTYEKTMQFNHCDARYNFYSKEIDGRFRFRISSNDERNEAKLSWKRRLPTTTNSLVNKEEEVEVHILYDEVDNFLYLIENVMHFTLVESYERYRTVFINDDIEIESKLDIPAIIISKESIKNIEKCISNLSDKYKLPIMMMASGYDYKSISKILGISEATARKRIERGRTKLKNILSKEDL